MTQTFKILAKEMAEDGELEDMIVECDGRPLALHWVFEKLIVGVFGDEVKQEEERTEVEAVEDEGEGSDEGGDARKLMVKAEAMAEHLKVELEGFKMPSNLD